VGFAKNDMGSLFICSKMTVFVPIFYTTKKRAEQCQPFINERFEISIPFLKTF
jgi:hypothetical protein